MREIFDRIFTKRLVALIGNCKNSGKTTTLNYLLTKFKRAGVLTIGLDGESIDALYGTFKPKVHLQRGQYVCTIKEELKHNFEIVERISSNDLYVARALTQADVSIVNPGNSKNLLDAISTMKKHVDVIFIDGAFDEIFSISVVDSIVLCVGVDDAELLRFRSIYKLLRTPIKNLDLSDNAIYSDNKLIKIDCDLMLKDCLEKILHSYKSGDFLLVKGALTREMALTMKNVNVVVKDPSRVLLSWKEMEIFFSKGNKLFASRVPELLFISLNTFAHDGKDLEPDNLYHKVKAIVDNNDKLFNPMNGGVECFSAL